MVIPKRRSIVPPPVNSDSFLDYCHEYNVPGCDHVTCHERDPCRERCRANAAIPTPFVRVLFARLRRRFLLRFRVGRRDWNQPPEKQEVTLWVPFCTSQCNTIAR